MALVDRRTPCPVKDCDFPLHHEGPHSLAAQRWVPSGQPPSKPPTPLWAKVVSIAVATPVAGIVVGGLWYTCLWIWKAVIGL